jgi:hypothetical protein
VTQGAQVARREAAEGGTPVTLSGDGLIGAVAGAFPVLLPRP